MSESSPTALSTNSLPLERAKVSGSFHIGWRKSPLALSLVYIIHAWNAFCFILAASVVWSFTLHLLLIWFSNFFFYSLAEGVVGFPFVHFFTYMFRSWLLIRFSCQILLTAAQLTRDSVRDSSFQLYRVMVRGGAVDCYASTCVDPISYLEKYGSTQDFGYIDVALTVSIYASLDVLPFLLMLIYSPSVPSDVQFFAGIAALFHVALFHIAKTTTDVLAKVRSWREVGVGLAANSTPRDLTPTRIRFITYDVVESVIRRCGTIQEWAEVHCGVQQDNMILRYNLVLGFFVCLVAVFAGVGSTRGIVGTGVCLLAVFARRLSLKHFGQWNWLVIVCEKSVLIGVAVLLNLYDSLEHGAAALLVAMASQFHLERANVKRFRRTFFFLTVSFQTVLVIVVFVTVLAVYEQDSDYDAHFLLCKGCASFNTKDLPIKTPSSQRPLFCDMTFPLQRQNESHGEGSLFLSDFLRLSYLSYMDDVAFAESARVWFPGWSVHLNSTEPKTFSTVSHFQELRSPNNTTTVFVVRGTASPTDVMVDVTLFSPVVVPQMISLLGPDLVRISVNLMSSLHHMIFNEWIPRHYFEKLELGVKRKIESDPNSTIYLTGHSLGGGVAKLVAANTKVPAVTFSSPGIAHTITMASGQRDRIQYVEGLRNLLYTVAPQNDIVPLVDTQMGTVMATESNLNFAYSHLSGETLCELLHSCGSHGVVVDVPCDACPSRKHLFKGCDRN